jgi:hypothetical protein
MFFTAANPGMRYGGFVDYSKIGILRRIDSRYLPRTIFLERIGGLQPILRQMDEHGIDFPIILKPDSGERGWKVEKVQNQEELARYISTSRRRVLLQEFIDFPYEYGIMYARMPGAKRGSITSIVVKEQLSVVGDGLSSLQDLFQKSRRCRYHLQRLLEMFGKKLQWIPAQGELVPLIEMGTHSRGSTFRDGNSLISDDLVEIFDNLSQRIPGYYIGRYDVKTASYDDLLRGNFKIIELNGTASEPAHIYDPNYRLGRAYRDLFAHWRLMYKISKQNISDGVSTSSISDFFASLYGHLRRKRLSEA